MRHRQWYLESTLDIKLLTTPRLLPALARSFALMAPFVEFLNQPFVKKQKAKKLMFMSF